MYLMRLRCRGILFNMKKLNLFNNLIIDGEIGFDHATGWAIRKDVKSVEFEDGTILINPDFDIETIKLEKTQSLKYQIIDLQIRKDAGVKNGLNMTEEQNQIDALKAEIAIIEAL